MSKKRILIVDDSANEIRILMELLKDDYAILAANSGEKAIALAQGENKPDLVLMDVTMEPMNGYEACTELLKLNSDLPVIFVSANDSTEEILNGFDVGGIDYITKPISPEILSTKVKVALEQVELNRTLSAEKDQASGLVMSALQSAGNLSVVLGFLRKGLKVTNVDELGHALALGFKSYNLQSCVQLRSEQGAKTYSTHGAASALEDELLNRMSAIDERIIEQGKRMILNYESVSVLVRNMPVEDDVRCGELRDHTLMMVEDAHSLNLKVSKEQQLSTNRNSMIRQALEQSREVLVEIETIQKQHKSRNIKVMDELFADIQVSFFSMGLTEDQEEQLTSIIQEKLAKAMELEDEAQQLDDMLRGLTEQLDMLAKNS